MTTIVYDHKNKQIAIDGRLNTNGVIVSDNTEKWKSGEFESVWFFTGSPSDDSDLMLLSHNDKPDVKPDSTALVAKNNECWLVTFNGEFCQHTKLNYNFSIGSGWKFALSALDYGASAEEAIVHASKRDVYTGGKITVFDVESMEFME